MGEFIFTLVTVSVLNGAVGMLAPEGDIKKYVRMVGALCILLAIVSPLYGLFADVGFDFEAMIPDGEYTEEDYEKTFEEYLSKGFIGSAEMSLKRALSSNFDLDEEKFDLTVNASEDGGGAECVTVYLHTTAINTDPRKIKAYVRELSGAECDVIYD